MKAFVFPGQGAQFPGMGKDLYESNAEARALFEKANEILGFDIMNIMFNGTADELKQTRVTQPAVFLHSVVTAICLGDKFQPDMVGGHSLGEFSALVAAGALNFEDGLRLVSARAQAMQKACEAQPSTMAAIIGLADDAVEKICAEVNAEVGTCVPANYNNPGQLVISGAVEAVGEACTRLKAAGAKLPEIYLCCGTEDFLIENNRGLHRFLEAEGVPHEYRESKGIHDMVFWHEYIAKIVEWMFG